MSEENKYAPMPLHLDDKIMKGVAFIYNFHLRNNDIQKLNDGVKERLQFLEDKVTTVAGGAVFTLFSDLLWTDMGFISSLARLFLLEWPKGQSGDWQLSFLQSSCLNLQTFPRSHFPNL